MGSLWELMIFPQIHKGAKTLPLHFPTKAPNPKFEAVAQHPPPPPPSALGEERHPASWFTMLMAPLEAPSLHAK